MNEEELVKIAIKKRADYHKKKINEIIALLSSLTIPEIFGVLEAVKLEILMKLQCVHTEIHRNNHHNNRDSLPQNHKPNN